MLVLVPKRDELLSAAAVFGFDPSEPDELVNERYEAWDVLVEETAVRVVCANGQGSAKIALATRAALGEGDYAVAICMGTSAGRSVKTAYLDVVLATTVLDAQEWRAVPGRLEPQWDEALRPSSAALNDIGAFVNSEKYRHECRELLVASAPAANALSISETWPRLHDGWVATTGFLHQDPAFLDQLWSLHSRLRAVDMETAGFVDACTSDARERPWFVIRSVSDYGTLESKTDNLRPLAGMAAAAVTRTFIASGLQQCHPMRLNLKTENAVGLSDSNAFVRLAIAPFLAAELDSRLGITLDADSLPVGTTISDLVVHLTSAPHSRQEIVSALQSIREDYFTTKYGEYEDEYDVRGYIGAAWAEDLGSSYQYLGVLPRMADVLYVGVGTGRDLDLVCPIVGSLSGADVSASMLLKAQQRRPEMTAVHAGAEHLVGVDDSSIDLYLSLRTYQSSLFDVPASLREAFRVLRPLGGLVISIPSGILDRREDGTFRYLPGLNIGGSSRVDRAAPRTIGESILKGLDDLMFDRVGYHNRGTDLYIYARKPGPSTDGAKRAVDKL